MKLKEKKRFLEAEERKAGHRMEKYRKIYLTQKGYCDALADGIEAALKKGNYNRSHVLDDCFSYIYAFCEAYKAKRRYKAAKTTQSEARALIKETDELIEAKKYNPYAGGFYGDEV